jgi:alkylhydroperoxidase family enzyme
MSRSARCAYARDVTKNVAASEATLEPLRRYFTAEQIVAIGYYNMLNRLNESLQVEYDFA